LLERADALVDALGARSIVTALGRQHGDRRGKKKNGRADLTRWTAGPWEFHAADDKIIRVGRVIGFDVGERRIGVAISDATATLARPVDVLIMTTLANGAAQLAADAVTRLGAEDDAIDTIVVGLPRRLDGSPNEMTPRVQAFAADLQKRTGMTVVLQDERLTSREAESRLAVREKDWRARKRRLDAAAAAIILQDYLDTRPGRPIPVADDPEF
jgi:putative Holliday junction resolvase